MTSSERIKKLVLLAILVSLAVILSIVDKTISYLAFSFLPTAKIGLANIVVLFSLYKYGFKDTFLIVILKSVLVGLILGSPVTFIISIVASVASFLGMFCAKYFLESKSSSVGISVIGGVIHIVAQLIVVAYLYNLKSVVAYYGVLLLGVSLITSIIIGLINNKLIKYINI